MNWFDLLYVYDDIYEAEDFECSICGQEISELDYDNEAETYICFECWKNCFERKNL